MNSYKILIVDDEADLCAFLEDFLGKRGCEISTAADADTALALIKEKSPDHVFLDLSLKMSQGITVLRNIKELGVKGKVTILTGDHTYELDEEAKELGAVGVIYKPVELAKLSEYLKQIKKE